MYDKICMVIPMAIAIKSMAIHTLAMIHIDIPILIHKVVMVMIFHRKGIALYS